LVVAFLVQSQDFAICARVSTGYHCFCKVLANGQQLGETLGDASRVRNRVGDYGADNFDSVIKTMQKHKVVPIDTNKSEGICPRSSNAIFHLIL
jgi:hypothetical protein